AIGTVAGVPEALLGATLLAWGASAGDISALLATTRQGKVNLAMPAVFAGPLFQLLAGTGLCLIYVNVTRGSVRFQMASNLPVAIAFSLSDLVVLCLAVPLWRKFVFNKKIASVLACIFMANIIAMSYLGFTSTESDDANADISADTSEDASS
ncbi:hypothetical protein CYMTET_49740, partial [Cymbomonas tetramitiformis]